MDNVLREKPPVSHFREASGIAKGVKQNTAHHRNKVKTTALSPRSQAVLPGRQRWLAAAARATLVASLRGTQLSLRQQGREREGAAK